MGTWGRVTEPATLTRSCAPLQVLMQRRVLTARGVWQCVSSHFALVANDGIVGDLFQELGYRNMVDVVKAGALLGASDHKRHDFNVRQHTATLPPPPSTSGADASSLRCLRCGNTNMRAPAGAGDCVGEMAHAQECAAPLQ